MKLATFILTAILLTMASGNASAQISGWPVETLQQLEGFVGKWEGQYDPLGSVPAWTVHVDCHWMGNKTYLCYEVTFRPDGSEFTLNPMNVIVGYSGKTKAAHAWQFRIGSQASTPATISKNRVVMKDGEDFDIAGKQQNRTVVYELRSPDEFVATNSNITKDGEPQPDEEPVVMKRVK